MSIQTNAFGDKDVFGNPRKASEPLVTSQIGDCFSSQRMLHINAALEKYPKAKAIAVRNFAGTAPLEDAPPYGARGNNNANLSMDARSYRWNEATVAAIKMALDGIYKEAGIV
jgi:hypothetical protein